MAHASYAQIARECGVTGPTAWSDVQFTLNDMRTKLRESACDWVELESRRLDKMALALWPAVQKGEPESIRAAVAIMKRRAALLGLDAPKRVEMSGADGGPVQVATAFVSMTAEQLAARMAELGAALKVLPATPVAAPMDIPTPVEPADDPAAAYARELAERGNGGNGSNR